MKNKNSGSKSTHLKIANPKAASSGNKRGVRRGAEDSGASARPVAERAEVQKSTAQKAAAQKSVAQKIQAAQRPATAVSTALAGGAKAVGRTVKLATAERNADKRAANGVATMTASKPQKAKLKLIAKPGARVPVSKITRSEPTTPGQHTSSGRISSGHFGSEGVAKPVLVVRAVSTERTGDNSTTSVLEAVAFKVGDKIVHPKHGVGEIKGIGTTVFGGEEHHIYNILILDSGMKVMVPVSQATAVGLRRIIDKRAIDKVYEILRDRDFKIDTQTWNRRFREYSQKINTGSVFEIALVLRDLSVLSADKELSFGEKKMLEKAEKMLVSEIAIARARPDDKVRVELRALFT